MIQVVEQGDFIQMINQEETRHIVSYDTDGFILNTNNSNSNASSTSYIAWN